MLDSVVLSARTNVSPNMHEHAAVLKPELLTVFWPATVQILNKPLQAFAKSFEVLP